MHRVVARLLRCGGEDDVTAEDGALRRQVHDQVTRGVGGGQGRHLDRVLPQGQLELSGEVRGRLHRFGLRPVEGAEVALEVFTERGGRIAALDQRVLLFRGGFVVDVFPGLAGRDDLGVREHARAPEVVPVGVGDDHPVDGGALGQPLRGLGQELAGEYRIVRGVDPDRATRRGEQAAVGEAPAAFRREPRVQVPPQLDEVSTRDRHGRDYADPDPATRSSLAAAPPGWRKIDGRARRRQCGGDGTRPAAGASVRHLPDDPLQFIRQCHASRRRPIGRSPHRNAPITHRAWLKTDAERPPVTAPDGTAPGGLPDIVAGCG